MDLLKRNKLYITLFLTAFFYYYWFSAGWFFQGEFWAETGSNYWLATRQLSFINQLALPDYGYGVYLLRILSFLISKITPSSLNIANVFNFISILIVIGSCLSIFYYLENKMHRWEAILLTTSLFLIFDFESRTFINAPYSLVIPLILFIVTTIDGRKPKLFEVIIFPLVIFSKPLIFPLAIPYLIALLFSRHKRFFSISLLIIIGSFEIINILNQQGLGGAKNHFSIENIILGVVFFIGKFIIGENIKFNSTVILMALSLLFILVMVTIFIIKKHRFELIFSIVIIYAITSNIMMNVLALPGWDNPSAILKGLPLNRHIIISNISMLMFVMICLVTLRKSISLRPVSVVVAFLLWFVGSGWYVSAISTSQYEPKIVASSNWSLFINDRRSVNLSMDCIPIDPLGWAVGSCRSTGKNNWTSELFYSPQIIGLGSNHLFEIPNDLLNGSNLCALGLMVSTVGGANAYFEAAIKSGNKEVVGRMVGVARTGAGQVVLRPTSYGCINNAKLIEIRSSAPYSPMVDRLLEFNPIFYVN